MEQWKIGTYYRVTRKITDPDVTRSRLSFPPPSMGFRAVLLVSIRGGRTRTSYSQ